MHSHCEDKGNGYEAGNSQINTLDEVSISEATVQNLNIQNSSVTIFNFPILIDATTKVVKANGRISTLKALKPGKQVVLTAQERKSNSQKHYNSKEIWFSDY
ncbi:MAG: hypothetical protein HY819_11475 [Acidobacteria bacterium]|nr:hypothetical protein [Acidobacteriota bacterium]